MKRIKDEYFGYELIDGDKYKIYGNIGNDLSYNHKVWNDIMEVYKNEQLL